MKIFCYKLRKAEAGFSLAEMIGALVIGAMVMVSVLAIYQRAESSVSAISRKLDGDRLGAEVLQLIAEDLDRLTTAGKDVKITIANKLDNLYPTARMVILKTYGDKKNEKQTFEKIVWQTGYDYESFDEGLVLYRSHSGIGMEDKLLDEEKEGWERELFVPICSGVTFFRIEIPTYELMPKARPSGANRRQSAPNEVAEEEQIPEVENFEDSWTKETLPTGVLITLSFAEPFKAIDGSLDVYEDEKFKRIIAINRARKIKFKFIKRAERQDLGLEKDANDIDLLEGILDESKDDRQKPNQFEQE